MKRMTALLSAAAVVLATTSLVLAQGNPNFSGTWVRQDPAPAAGAPAGGGGGGRGGGRGGGGGLGAEVTITQTPTTITLAWEQPGRQGGPATPQKREYKLDGTESKNMVMARGEQTEQVSKAAWAAGKLTVTTTTAAGEMKQVFSMNGADLNVEQTTPGFQGGAPMTTTMVYKKK
jgi:hypothetical protein